MSEDFGDNKESHDSHGSGHGGGHHNIDIVGKLAYESTLR